MKIWIRGALFEPQDLPDIARATEAAGLYGFGLSDHILYPHGLGDRYPYAEEGYSAEAAWPDPWVAAAALSQITTTLHFTTWIYIAPPRSPLAIAKAVATAQNFAQGRIAFGGAIGWLPEEYAAMGVDFKTRGKRFSEMLEVLRSIWAGGWIEHSGEFFEIERCLVSPQPTHPVPIWVGGDSDKSLQRAARYDGWLGLPYDLETVRGHVERLKEFRSQAGTLDRDDYEVMSNFHRVPTPDDLSALEEIGLTSVIVAPWERDYGFLEKVEPAIAIKYIEEYGRTFAAELT
jgi:probable F420-dependent oxidoreductase